jgi:hypothetical protein
LAIDVLPQDFQSKSSWILDKFLLVGRREIVSASNQNELNKGQLIEVKKCTAGTKSITNIVAHRMYWLVDGGTLKDWPWDIAIKCSV